MSSPPLSVAEVTKEFSTVRAVDRLSFDIQAGEIFALLGPNGAGKSTTVRMLVGILRPDTGTVRFDLGSGARRVPAAGELGYLPEERGLYRDAPVSSTLEHFAVLHGMTRADARAAAKAGLERFELGDRARDRVDALSKGNQQKVQYLAATLHHPRFAILDEPFSGLDPVNQQRFLDEIRALRDDGCTVLLSAHQMDLVETIADRVLVLDKGAGVLSGTLEEIRDQTRSGLTLRVGVAAAAGVVVQPIGGIRTVSEIGPGQLELHLDTDADVGRVLHELTGLLPVTSVETSRETLRDIFLRTVQRPTTPEVAA